MRTGCEPTRFGNEAKTIIHGDALAELSYKFSSIMTWPIAFNSAMFEPFFSAMCMSAMRAVSILRGSQTIIFAPLRLALIT